MAKRLSAPNSLVSIPMTVLGGLQWHLLIFKDNNNGGFNTDDGIRRATMKAPQGRKDGPTGVSIPMTVLGGLQSAVLWSKEDLPPVSIPMTVLGGLQFARTIRSSTTISRVSIPMTVLGGLQFLIGKFRYVKHNDVSIPMTVLGGLQYGVNVVAVPRVKKFQYR